MESTREFIVKLTEVLIALGVCVEDDDGYITNGSYIHTRELTIEDVTLAVQTTLAVQKVIDNANQAL